MLKFRFDWYINCVIFIIVTRGKQIQIFFSRLLVISIGYHGNPDLSKTIKWLLVCSQLSVKKMNLMDFKSVFSSSIVINELTALIVNYQRSVFL